MPLPLDVMELVRLVRFVKAGEISPAIGLAMLVVVLAGSSMMADSLPQKWHLCIALAAATAGFSSEEVRLWVG